MSADRSKWILPFKGRNHSGAFEQNFVWKSGNVYVMDNHRAALWCWLQELDLKAPHSLFHIDQHTDALQSRLDDWLKNLPAWSSSLQDYLDHSYRSEFGETKVIRWDNYLSIYLAEFGKNLKACHFATHGDGDKPNCDHVMEAHLWDLPGNLDYWLSANAAPWIMNIDLDYFFWEGDGTAGVIVSDEFLETTFSHLRRAIESGAVAVTTICLTPDQPFTPGWAASEQLAKKITGILGIDFELPEQPSNTLDQKKEY